MLRFPCKREPTKGGRAAGPPAVGAWGMPLGSYAADGQAQRKHEADLLLLSAGESSRGYLGPGVPIGLTESFSGPFGVTPCSSGVAFASPMTHTDVSVNV